MANKKKSVKKSSKKTAKKTKKKTSKKFKEPKFERVNKEKHPAPPPDFFKKERVPLRSDYDVAYDFSLKMYEIFQPTVKSIVLFGSSAKRTSKKTSDVDIIIVVDDATIVWDEELRAWYRTKLQRLVASLKYPKKLHVHTITMTSFYDQMLAGDPLIVNVLRYGLPLVDFGGFFQPLKILLAEGKIKPTRESIYVALNMAPAHLTRARFNILGAVEAYYWAMVDAAHAALMAVGKTPPSPEHIGTMMVEHFVRPGLLKMKFVDWYREMFAVAHHLSHGTVSEFDNKELALFRDRADKFVGEMASLVRKVED